MDYTLEEMRLTACIECGCELLDNSLGKDWINKIDMEKFKIDKNNQCICGQLFTSFMFGLDILFNQEFQEEIVSAENHGFYIRDAAQWQWDLLQELWVKKLKKLQHKDRSIITRIINWFK